MNRWKITSIVFATLFVGAVGGSYIKSASAERQPRMHTAEELLQDAKAVLQKATPDKGGHRVAAIGHIDQAIAEVKLGIEFDNTHH